MLLGTSTEQDSRFSDKDARLLKSMKFDSILDKKVDMRKVNLGVMRPWVTKRVVELVGLEDEVVVEYAMELLEDKSNPVRVIYNLQLALGMAHSIALLVLHRLRMGRKCRLL